MMKKCLAGVLLAAALNVGGCGYSLSPTPYGLMEPMSVNVPVAGNRSRFGELGPLLSASIINKLDASSNITVSESAPATLRLEIKKLSIDGGSWEIDDYNDEPVASASRVVNMSVEAILERPGVSGPEGVRRRTFNSNRNFLVSPYKAQVEMRQDEALKWIINDISQKICQMMFSEF